MMTEPIIPHNPMEDEFRLPINPFNIIEVQRRIDQQHEMNNSFISNILLLGMILFGIISLMFVF